MRIPSLPDWAFYPLAALAVTAMITGAVLMGGEERPLSADEIRSQGYIYEGESLRGLTVGPGLAVEYLTENDQSFARIAAERGPFDGVPHGGSFFALNRNQVEAFQGYSVIITATLRSPTVDGAETVQMNFFAGGRNQNDWETFNLPGSFEEVVFSVSTPSCEWEDGRSLIAFWPASSVGANTVDLARVEITASEAQDCP